jgi:F-type H+-transporting ATPase subunit a
MEVHVELAAETLFHIGPIPVTNSMLTMFIVMGAILIVFSWIARRAQMIPGRSQGVLEMIVEFLLSLVEGTGGKRVGRRIFPLIAGLFIFIIFANYSGLLPGVGTIGYCDEVIPEPGEHAETSSACEDHAEEAAESESHEEAATGNALYTIQSSSQEGGEGTAEAEGAAESEGEEGAAGAATTEEDAAAEGEEEAHAVWVLVPFFRSPNADLNMTLAMALVTFTVVQIAGIAAHGVRGRIKHMADPWWIFPLEVIQEFARIVSLSFRLFGNIFAGEVLLAVMFAMANAIKIVLIPVVFPVVFLFLEVLFGAIQALVFALLTLIYITLATAGGHGDEEHGHAHDEEHEGAHQPAAATGSAGD